MRAATETPATYGEPTLPLEFELRRIGAPAEPRESVNRPDVSARVAGEILRGLDHERLIVLHLDGKYRLIGWHEAARGNLNVVHVSPRQVLRPLLYSGAAAFVISHNHPSGDPTPSADDHELTRRLRAAGDVVGLPMLDHVVVADGGFYAFSTGGW